LTREFLFNTPRGFQLLKNTDLSLLEKFTDAVKGVLITKFKMNKFRNILFYLLDFNEFPSLLHFAACHGFERLTTVLLECPGAKEASTLRNASGEFEFVSFDSKQH